MKRWVLHVVCGSGILAGGMTLPGAEIPQRAELNLNADRVSGGEATTIASTLALAEQALFEAAAGLQARLVSSGHDRQAEWNHYLRWPEIQAALATRPLPRAPLERLVDRLSVDLPGIEDPACLALRGAAERWLALDALRDVDLVQDGTRRLGELREALNRYEREPTRELAEQIGAHLAWFETLGQQRELIESVRSRWSQPNFRVSLSHRFVSAYAEKEVHESSIQVTNILGTITRGPTTTQGRLGIEFVPNEQQAEVRLRLIGTTTANHNVGHKGPATIYSRSVTQINAQKTLRFDPQFGVNGEPAQAQCGTSARVKSIETDPKYFDKLLTPVVTKVARKKAQELHSAAEREASRIASLRIERQIEDQSIDSLSDAQKTFERYLKIGPLRINEPTDLRSRTTADRLEVMLLQARSHQLGAPGGPAELESNINAALEFHESLFNNITARYLFTGAEHSDESIEKLAKMLAGDVPPPLRVHSGSTPWALRLDLDRPLSMRFQEGSIELVIHTIRWTIDGREYSRPIDIRTVFRPEVSRFGPLFVRQGDIEVRPVDGQPFSADEALELVPLIEMKLGALLPPRGRFDNFIIPSGGSFGPVAQLRLKQLVCDGGWLILGYE